MFQTETALMYDAVHLFALAMGQLSVAGDIDTQSLSCNKKDTWDHGLSILNYMKIVRTITFWTDMLLCKAVYIDAF